MTDFKFYGKTYQIKEEIKALAKNVGGFTKYDKVMKIVLTDAKTTKGREAKIMEFAKEYNLQCYKFKYDGSEFAPDKSYSGFAKSLEDEA